MIIPPGHPLIIFLKNSTLWGFLCYNVVMINGIIKLRKHQQKVVEAFDKGFKNIILLWSRRAGKSIFAWNLLIREAIYKPGTYWFCFDEFRTAERNIWSAMTSDGVKFRDMIPKEMILSENVSKLKIELINGSIIQLVGINNADNLVGAGLMGVVFDEYAVLNPNSIDYITPMLAETGGWQVVISTPRGENHFYERWQFAQAHPEIWYSSNVHCGMPEIANYMAKGFLEETRAEIIAKYGNEALFQQEYMTSFTSPNSGSVFGDLVRIMREEHRIGYFSPEATAYYTAWDLGSSDNTSIVLFQVNDNGGITVFDHIENRNQDVMWYLTEIKERGWNVHTHFLPHDAAHRRGARNETYRQVMAKEGILNTVVLNKPNRVEDKLNFGRRLFAKSRIVETNKRLIECLEKLEYEYNSRNNVWSDKPTHKGGYSDTVDSFLYACQAVLKFGIEKDKRPNFLAHAKAQTKTYDDTPIGVQLFINQFYQKPKRKNKIPTI